MVMRRKDDDLQVILSVQSNDEIFDLAKIREKIESKKKTKISSSKDEIRK